MTDLSAKKCVPCEGGMSALPPDQVSEFLKQLPGWSLDKESGKKIKKTYQFKNFVQAMKFINHMADIAEEEGHHPDFWVHYNIVDVSLWTHAIDGLSENDFILAAKIDKL